MQTTITMTVERLQAMTDNGMQLYWTPGTDQPYWASRPNFSNDTSVGGVHDFVKASGYDTLSGMDDNEEVTATITLPA